ncbi:PREDICTED: uncharacterized protein LOC100635474 [Amphimedon queenslandica]|uniref:Major facilitator superfamily (MFS) profile domain-containing protein n=1 Tax=Amphimedon queenslandica TaxID=400682 RepID=A0A1X7VHT7_AMPQE|nr:PREDICTED: uncharacterized protein LOC100635474 [Amphimedon queenslandica]|eukprot:XP_003384209.2 PREDICTED: uncharacterized protein LOC100635474 [Amphimedon queenslandica]
MPSYSSLCIYWRWPGPTIVQRLQMILVLMSCFLFHLSIGSIYTYGNLLPYLVSYARNHTNQAELKNTQGTYIFSIQVFGLAVGMLAGGVLEKKFGPRLVSLSGGWLMSAGVALSYFAVKKNFWYLTMTYGIMFGLGTGISYIGPIACAIRWCPRWKGAATGFVVSGYGISSLIFTTVQTAYVNPHNVEPIGPVCDMEQDTPESCDNEKYFEDAKMMSRIPTLFLLLAGVYASLQLISSIFLVNPPPPLADEEKRPILIHEDSPSPRVYSPSTSMSRSALINKKLDTLTVVNVTPLQLFRKPSFYLIWFMFACIGIGTSFITTLYKSFGLEKVTDDDWLLSIAGAVSSVFNLSGRFFWGALADFTSYRTALVFHGALATFIYFTFYATGAAGIVMFFFWLFGIYFCIGGSYSLYPSLVAQLYGTENISINYSFVYSSQIVGSLLASFLSHLLVDYIDWYGVFFIVGGLSLVEYILAILYNNKRYIRN